MRNSPGNWAEMTVSVAIHSTIQPEMVDGFSEVYRIGCIGGVSVDGMMSRTKGLSRYSADTLRDNTSMRGRSFSFPLRCIVSVPFLGGTADTAASSRLDPESDGNEHT